MNQSPSQTIVKTCQKRVVSDTCQPFVEKAPFNPCFTKLPSFWAPIASLSYTVSSIGGQGRLSQPFFESGKPPPSPKFQKPNPIPNHRQNVSKTRRLRHFLVICRVGYRIRMFKPTFFAFSNRENFLLPQSSRTRTPSQTIAKTYRKRVVSDTF